MLAGANPAHRPAIAACLAAAEAGSAAATPREQRHVAALTAWRRGALGDAFAIWRELLDADPTDLLAVRNLRHHAFSLWPYAGCIGTGGSPRSRLVA